MNANLKSYFKTYPTHSEVFETADGFQFHEDFDAKAHARSLEDKTVIRHERPGGAGSSAEDTTGLAGPTAESLVEKGVDAVAPVVVDGATVVSPGAHETSTSPVAAPNGDGLLPVLPTGTEQVTIAKEDETVLPALKAGKAAPAKKK